MERQEPKTLRDTLLENNDARLDRQEIRKRCGNAMARKLPLFLYCKNDAKTWAVIGGGPSINDCVKDIRRLKKAGANIVSVNKSHDWLLENGIVPWAHVLLDPQERVKDYVKRPRKDVRYFVASQCHASVFDALDGYPVFLWHAGQDFPFLDLQEPTAYLREYWTEGSQNWICTPGPTTVGLRVPYIGHQMGADHFHMFGMDSSRSNGKLHGYDKDEIRDAQCPDLFVKHNGFKYRFETNSHMARQQADFDKMVEDLPSKYQTGLFRKEFTMTIHGSGLLPFYAAKIGWHANPECNKNPEKVGGFVSCESMWQRRPLLAV